MRSKDTAGLGYDEAAPTPQPREPGCLDRTYLHDVRTSASRPAWFRDAFWRSAPWVLRRYPALFGAVLAGTALLTLAAAAYPLFLSATASEIVAAAMSDRTSRHTARASRTGS